MNESKKWVKMLSIGRCFSDALIDVSESVFQGGCDRLEESG